MRSKYTMIIAAVTIGIANSVRNMVTSIDQVKGGMRMRVIPGARMLSTVTMMLIAVAVEPMPSITMPTHQKLGPMPGSAPPEIGVLVSGV